MNRAIGFLFDEEGPVEQLQHIAAIARFEGVTSAVVAVGSTRPCVMASPSCSCSQPATAGVYLTSEAVEGVPDAAHRLADAVLVLDQGKADESLSRFAEAHAGADGDLGSFEEVDGEVD